jgi:hypothetical protein
MSEVKEKYTLEEFVFRDIRLEESTRKDYRKDVQAVLEKYKTVPVKKVTEYQWIMSVKYDQRYPDAERWEFALESYTNYPKFWDNNHLISKSENLIRYNGIRITADTLTGTKEIIDCSNKAIEKETDNKKKQELQTALKKFCSVAYTAGNCCPVMFNPSPNAINIPADTCWHKLKKYIVPGEKYPSIEYFSQIELNYRGRKPDSNDNMFAMFPEEKLSGKEIIKRLMLQDYYKDPDCKELLFTQTPLEIWNKGVDGVDKYIIFLNDISKLIIKRGIRIYYRNDFRGIRKIKENESFLDTMTEELFNSL